MDYIKQDNKIYKVTEIKEEVDLAGLKMELANLEAMSPPTDKELIEYAKVWHPYYADRLANIDVLTRKIVEVEGI